ncbi:MAG TPA: Uxx-star family glutaredoxin-like (seleno)protein [Candidatus Paceibacterota bacterium]
MNKVLIYTTPTCPYCKIAEEYFRSKDVAFEEIDVVKNPSKQGELLQKSQGRLGVPVIDIDGHIIFGFDKGQVEKYLALRK